MPRKNKRILVFLPDGRDPGLPGIIVAPSSECQNAPMSLDRLSIELTNRCQKSCWVCYNHSHAAGDEAWTADEIVGLVVDCHVHGLRAVSFGGGEPLESPLLWEVLARLQGKLFRSLTTNGLLLRGEMLEQLVAAKPDKVHVSIHFPEHDREVARVIEQVTQLTGRGVRSGVNLLVARSNLAAATKAARKLQQAGIDNHRIVYLPMRGQDTPSPREIEAVAGGPFQSMTCLGGCAASPRFCSIAWDRTVAWCSYTTSRRPLAEMSYAGLMAALDNLPLVFCGNDHDQPRKLHRLGALA